MPESLENVNVYGMTIHDTLNQDIFIGTSLKVNVKKALMRIADEFVSYIDNAPAPVDVRIVGSSINYHWSKSSDLDLHIVFNFSKFPCPEDKDFIREYLLAKKKTFNDRHDIEIFGMEVELYPEDVGDDTKSSAIYSVSQDKWIVKPSRQNVNTRRDRVRRVAWKFMQKIDTLETIESPDERLDKGMQIKDALMKLRKDGLAESGEYNYKNIAYKTLRNAGYLDKLFKHITESYDDQLSLEEPEPKY